MPKCTWCKREIDPVRGIGLLTPISHQCFCDKECYGLYQTSLDALEETEAGNDISPIREEDI